MADVTHKSEGARKAILVLGMHRSGTSALAGVLARLGAAPPKTLIEADQHNLKGYLESPAIVDFNDRILASAGSNWRDWETFDPNWIKSPFATSFAAEFPALIGREFGEGQLFILKDPRLCRILPFWLEQLDRLQITPKVLLIVRNPLEVAASLKKRDGFPTRISLLLWLRYLLDAEDATRDLPRCWIHHDALLCDWRGTIDKLSNTLGIDLPNRTPAVVRDVDRFLSRSLTHHHYSLEDVLAGPDVLAWVKTAYTLLHDHELLGRDAPTELESLRQIRLNFDAACEAFRPLVATELRRTISDLERLSREIDKRNSEIKKLRSREKKIDYIMWRVLYPIQQLRAKFAARPNTAEPASKGEPAPSSSENPRSASDKAEDEPAAPAGTYFDRGSLASALVHGAVDIRNRKAWFGSPLPRPAVSAAAAEETSPPTHTAPNGLEFEHKARSQIAVVCHVYYLTMWDELADQIEQIPAPVDLFVTIADQLGANDLSERLRNRYPNAQIRIVPNHGRDILPFLLILNSGILDSYYLVCKLHTKRSLHRSDGEFWRRKLLFGMLGSPKNVTDILRGFNADPMLGLVVADGEIYEGAKGWRENRDRCEELATNLGIRLDDYPPRFACGSIFWSRGSALKPLRNLSLSAGAFEVEDGSVDGTTAHAIERLFSIFAMAEGFRVLERSEI